MPSFDISSEVDEQEIRNAVDQASREIANRFDFKNTDSSIELGTNEITMRSVTADRLTALRQVLEEKLVKRQISLKAVDYGKVEDAAGGTVRQVAVRHQTALREVAGPDIEAPIARVPAPKVRRVDELRVQASTTIGRIGCESKDPPVRFLALRPACERPRRVRRPRRSARRSRRREPSQSMLDDAQARVHFPCSRRREEPCGVCRYA